MTTKQHTQRVRKSGSHTSERQSQNSSNKKKTKKKKITEKRQEQQQQQQVENTSFAGIEIGLNFYN